MICWAPFQYGEATYDLSHLHPRQVVFRQAAADGRPEREYVVQVIFGLHCFTRNPKDGEPAPEPALWYSDSRESRIFDFGRYELSKQLPGVIDQLLERKCYHSGKGNFFVVELVTVDGQKAEYEIYFDASRASVKGVVNLYVQSAYVRDQKHAGNRPKRKPIRFQIILFNIANGRPISIPK